VTVSWLTFEPVTASIQSMGAMHYTVTFSMTMVVVVLVVVVVMMMMMMMNNVHVCLDLPQSLLEIP